jgi:hypothetical protein
MGPKVLFGIHTFRQVVTCYTFIFDLLFPLMLCCLLLVLRFRFTSAPRPADSRGDRDSCSPSLRSPQSPPRSSRR